MTRLDEFILSSTLLVFLALAEGVFTVRLASSGRRALAARVDRVARVVLPVAFLVFTVWTLLF